MSNRVIVSSTAARIIGCARSWDGLCCLFISSFSLTHFFLSLWNGDGDHSKSYSEYRMFSRMLIRPHTPRLCICLKGYLIQVHAIICTYCKQGVHKFYKIFRRQKGDVKQFPYWRPTVLNWPDSPTAVWRFVLDACVLEIFLYVKKKMQWLYWTF